MPGRSKRRSNEAPGAITGEEPSARITSCSTVSLFVQRTTSGAGPLAAANAKFEIELVTLVTLGAAGAVAFGGAAGVAAFGAVVAAAVADVVALPVALGLAVPLAFAGAGEAAAVVAEAAAVVAAGAAVVAEAFGASGALLHATRSAMAPGSAMPIIER